MSKNIKYTIIIILIIAASFLFFKKDITELGNNNFNESLTNQIEESVGVDNGLDEGAKLPIGSLAPVAEVEEEKKNGIVETIKEVFAPDLNKVPTKVELDVPFTAQAPFAEWDDPRQQDGCEEASLIMAWHWINDEQLTKKEAKKEILSLSKFEEEELGEFADTSMTDTVEIFKKYYNYDKIKIIYDFEAQGIKDELLAGNIVLAPSDGTVLKNPYYTQPGPVRHMIVIKGYDDKKEQFITNDPGTRRGDGFRFDYEVVMSAIINYSTGLHAPLIDERKIAIVVEKP